MSSLSAIVDGIQSRGVGTSVKHYAANNQETDRLRVDAQVDERTLREIYLPAFERVVTASQPWTVMCSYNKVNGHLRLGEPLAAAPTVLREEWGFEGLVVSDWGAVYDRVPRPAGRDWIWRCRRLSAAARSEIVAAVGAGDGARRGSRRPVRTVLELVAEACRCCRARRDLRRRRPPRAGPGGGRGVGRCC